MEALQGVLEESQIALAQLQAGLEQQQNKIEQFLHLLRTVRNGGRQVFVFAPGRSGLVAQAFCSRLAQMGMRAHTVGALTTLALEPGDLLILMSSSGKTRITLFMAELSQEYDAQLVVITANPHAPLAQRADLVLTVPGPLPEGKLPLHSLSEQMAWLFLDGLVVELLEYLQLDKNTIATTHPNLE